MPDQHPHFAAADWRARLRVAAFTPATTRDWPGRRVATVFLQGCPWRCAYCHNPALQTRGGGPLLPWAQVAGQLAAQRGALDGVVFSGGEPTADSALPEALAAVRALGLGTGLHTNGAYPERLARALPLLDWVGFDLKSDDRGYDVLTGAPGSARRVTESARLLVASGVAHEFRLTWHPTLQSEASTLLIAHFAQHLGAQRFVLQTYQPEGVSAATLAAGARPAAALCAQLRALFADFAVRDEICGLADGALEG